MRQFKSQVEIKVLGYYFLNPQAKHYINELADLLQVDPGNLYRKLKELEREGVLISEKSGNQKYYFLNKKYPLLRELKKTYEAKFGIENLLKNKLSSLKGLQEAYVFGSFAANKLQQESDIDVLLIGTHSSIAAKKLIVPLQNTIKREINIIDMTPDELKKRKKEKDRFIDDIFSKKMIRIF